MFGHTITLSHELKERCPMLLAIMVASAVTVAGVGVGGYFLGCWRTEARCWREELQRHATSSQPLKQGDTAELVNYARDRLRRERFIYMIHDKGVRRDGGSGDLH